MKKDVIFILLAISLFSCNESVQEKSPELQTILISDKVEDERETISKETVAEQSVYSTSPIHLKFKEFELVIDSTEVWDEEERLKTILLDTAIVYLELGESIEGRKIRINKLYLGNIKVYQRFENSVTIMNEGPHCDLTEWKHYDSEWKQLAIKDGQFTTNSYSEEDWERFIEVDMNELREAVKNYCGDFWANHIKEVKSPLDYPCGVGTSRIFLKFEIEDFKTKENLVRIVSFEIPMGC